MKILISELEGLALDYAMAKSLPGGYEVKVFPKVEIPDNYITFVI